ncbi:hypothetical protein SAMN05444410_10314 [Hydrobacter penzbergensis]|uniref:Uncharacterized protein n=1 Tax=Hydrobacter penzbergensis TaxID=1235997 RepID=A0A8X8IA95_9BACT|nr:hypothetical protein SAMN05444410_10314 [Hydrobacter penzbergensis]
MSLVRSYRSNLTLKQDLAKSKVFGIKISDRGIKSAVVYAAKCGKARAIFISKPRGQPE